MGLKHLCEADECVSQVQTEFEILQPQVQQKAMVNHLCINYHNEWFYVPYPQQEAESLLQQLSWEQHQYNVLRLTVASEREKIATETKHVASLAKASLRLLG